MSFEEKQRMQNVGEIDLWFTFSSILTTFEVSNIFGGDWVISKKIGCFPKHSQSQSMEHSLPNRPSGIVQIKKFPAVKCKAENINNLTYCDAVWHFTWSPLWNLANPLYRLPDTTLHEFKTMTSKKERTQSAVDHDRENSVGEKEDKKIGKSENL